MSTFGGCPVHWRVNDSCGDIMRLSTLEDIYYIMGIS